MALSATILKTELQIADMDRHHYETYNLTIAQHPSENDERLIVRLLAFALNAHEELAFTKGLSTDDEPDLWQKSLSGEIELWVDLGQPDEKRIRKACGRARQVSIYTYNSRSAAVWWKGQAGKLERFNNLSVIHLPNDISKELSTLVQRNMNLQCTIQDGQVWLSDGEASVMVEPEAWK